MIENFMVSTNLRRSLKHDQLCLDSQDFAALPSARAAGAR